MGLCFYPLLGWSFFPPMGFLILLLIVILSQGLWYIRLMMKSNTMNLRLISELWVNLFFYIRYQLIEEDQSHSKWLACEPKIVASQIPLDLSSYMYLYFTGISSLFLIGNFGFIHLMYVCFLVFDCFNLVVTFNHH